MNDKTHWSSHVEWAVLLVTLIGGFYMIDGKIERQMTRTDKLYEMYCNQQKEFDKRFYDLLKENKAG